MVWRVRPKHTMSHPLRSHTSRCMPTSIDQLLTGSSLCEQADLAVSCATEHCVLWWNGMEMRNKGRLWEFSFHCVKLTDLWVPRRTSVLQHVCWGSLLGPWENKGVRLHLFVSVPWGIKVKDISSRPARISLTHLRVSYLSLFLELCSHIQRTWHVGQLQPGLFTTMGEVVSERGRADWQGGSWKDKQHCGEIRRELYRRPNTQSFFLHREASRCSCLRMLRV